MKPVLIKDLGMSYPTSSSKHLLRHGIYECPFCKKHFKTATQSVKRGLTKSCGCYADKVRGKNLKKHGLANTKLYCVRKDMITRCHNKSSRGYKDYGARGISVCEEWRNDISKFYDWAMKNGYSEGLSIDRIDNDGNYEPKNCRFVGSNVQKRNTRRLRSTNTSGYRGVSFHKASKKWRATIKINGNQVWLGLFSKKEEAALAYDKYVIANKLEHTTNGLMGEF
jgi:hypothetical protein